MQNKIYFTNSNGQKLCGIFSDPTQDKSKLAVILCHGFTSNKDSSKYVALEPILNQEDITTLRFDFYGHGESEGKFENITISEAVDDILEAITFLEEQGYKKIGLVGSSFGGISSIMAASQSESLAFLILISSVSNYIQLEDMRLSKYALEAWKEDGFIEYDTERNLRLKYAFYEDAKINIAYDVAKNILIPTLIIHGDKDTEVPVEQGQRLATLIPHNILEIIPGADHRYTQKEHFKQMIDRVFQFIIEHR